MSANLGPVRNPWNPRILQQSIISLENTVNYKHVDFIAFAFLALKQHVNAQSVPVSSQLRGGGAPRRFRKTMLLLLASGWPRRMSVLR